MRARGRHWQRSTREVFETFSIHQLVAILHHSREGKVRSEQDRELLERYVQRWGGSDDAPTRFRKVWEELELRDMLFELRRLAFRKQDGPEPEMVGAFIRLCDLLLLNCSGTSSAGPMLLDCVAEEDESSGFVSSVLSVQELARCLDAEVRQATAGTPSNSSAQD